MAGTGTKALASEFNAAKSRVTTALSTVGRSWSWTNSVAAGTTMTAVAMEELKSALDYAGSGISSGYAHYPNYSNYANNGNNSCSSNHSSQWGDNSNDGDNNDWGAWNTSVRRSGSKCGGETRTWVTLLGQIVPLEEL